MDTKRKPPDNEKAAGANPQLTLSHQLNSSRITRAESKRLAELEQVIERGFVEVGNALLEIRDTRLYRDKFATFEDYCRGRWGFVASRARQLIGAAETIKDLQSGSVTFVTLPNSESVARELSGLEPDAKCEIWQEAVKTAPNGKITAVHVRRVSDERQAYLKQLRRETAELKDKRAQLNAPEPTREVERFVAEDATPEEIADSFATSWPHFVSKFLNRYYRHQREAIKAKIREWNESEL